MSIPFIFIDRDDTIIHDIPYLGDPALVQLTPGAGRALKAFAEAGFKIALVTNQSGIGRGLITLGDMHRVNARMMELLAVDGARIDDVFYCPHCPGDNCNCRKPATGMLQQACKKYDVDIPRSFLIGDSKGDILMGKAFGIKTIQIQLPGKNKPELNAHITVPTLPDVLNYIGNLKK